MVNIYRFHFSHRISFKNSAEPTVKTHVMELSYKLLLDVQRHMVTAMRRRSYIRENGQRDAVIGKLVLASYISAEHSR